MAELTIVKQEICHTSEIIYGNGETANDRTGHTDDKCLESLILTEFKPETQDNVTKDEFLNLFKGVGDVNKLPGDIRNVEQSILCDYGFVLINDDGTNITENQTDTGVIITALNCNTFLYKCNLCKKKFTTKCKIDLHKLNHCPKCYKLCKSREECDKHTDKHCSKCLVVIDNKEELDRHVNKHCTFVGCLDLVEDSVRKKHMVTHENDNKPYQCVKCKRRYKNYKTKMKHYEFCSSGENIKCQFCNQQFPSKTKALKHVFNRHVK